MEITTAVTAMTKAEIDVQDMANQYLATILDTNYRAVNGFFANGYWYFLIRYQNAERELIGTGAKLVIDAQNQVVMPLAAEQIQDISESPSVFMAQTHGTLARTSMAICSVIRPNASRPPICVTIFLCITAQQVVCWRLCSDPCGNSRFASKWRALVNWRDRA